MGFQFRYARTTALLTQPFRCLRAEELLVPFCMYSGTISSTKVVRILAERLAGMTFAQFSGGTLTFFYTCIEELIVPLQRSLVVAWLFPKRDSMWGAAVFDLRKWAMQCQARHRFCQVCSHTPRRANPPNFRSLAGHYRYTIFSASRAISIGLPLHFHSS